ncbi:biphenyl-2,3-diol 1,2-dioxygenase [Novosphingobium sp. KCTC 2891]|uniref:biphenyl-2,3-diol 1,2-dioxygenase n=1 Tax=Novosphingobium sp. KCTC 2891 TaxID=2989730 RepID=UPI002221B220|nr:biphenyl-2,3-diol 1,2-dioxygenase [Novosphingobium sp. KCTC 2891]MCW1384358.1 biphenyl-2,3-diol 1,2-dioxygenase [Novosphingobium sp. KCTC 2891]
MSVVTELGYLGLSVSDLAAWRAYAAEVVGMEVVDEGEGDRLYLRMDLWHHRIVLHADGSDDLAYMGWRVAGPQEFAAMQEKLSAAGIPFTVGTEAEARERRVLGLLKLADPGGNPTEIFFGPQVDTHKPFHPGRPMFGKFLTGSQGIGHCILRQDDVEAAARFYELLGLRGSVEYHLHLPNGMVAQPYFMHCNERQHSVAFGLGPMEKRINHLMFEYTDLDDLGMAHDIVRGKKIDVALQLGKHANDQALTFYCANPSGWLWEFGWGARHSTGQQEYYTRDIFGHGNEAAGYGMDIPLL